MNIAHFFQINHLLEHGVGIIIVTDGRAPHLKALTIARRLGVELDRNNKVSRVSSKIHEAQRHKFALYVILFEKVSVKGSASFIRYCLSIIISFVM